MTEKIKVKFYDSDTVAEIVFNNNKIDVISTDSKNERITRGVFRNLEKKF